MIHSLALPALAILVGIAACAEQTAPSAPVSDLPPEPYRMVYTMASPDEVLLLDLNSVTRAGDVREAWSLAFLAQPTRFEGASQDAQVLWMRSRIDCAARTGTFIRAVGMKDGAPIFDVPVTATPTPTETAWPMDEDFICKDLQGARTAASTFVEAVTAARGVMTPPQPPADATGATPTASAPFAVTPASPPAN